MKAFRFGCLGCGLVLVLSVGAGAATYYVSSSGGSDDNTGLDQNTPFKTIQKALSTAGSNDTVLLKRGDNMTETPGIVWDKGDNLTLGAYGTGDRPIWTINPAYTFYQIFFHCCNSLTVNDIAFQATGTRQHAAVRCFGPKPMVFNNCKFYNLSYGLRVTCGSVVTAQNCYFELIYWGAYVYYENSSTSTFNINNCEFTGWLAGSATKNEGGVVNITNSKFHDFTSDNTTPSTSPDAFTWAVFGARFWGCAVNVSNSIFYNIPVARSRTIFQVEDVPEAPITAIHNTFFNNSTTVFRDLTTSYASSINATYNIIAGPGGTGDIGIGENDNGGEADAFEDYNLFYMLDGNFIILPSTVHALSPNSLSGQDPLFKSTDPADSDFLRLQNSSPAYNIAAGWYMGAFPPDNWPKTVTGTVILNNYAPGPNGMQVSIELRKVGGSTLTYTRTLDGDGKFTITDAIESGTYNVWVKGQNRWLAKLQSGFAINGDTIIANPFSLIDGDCDGNNVINSADLSIILIALDTVSGSGGFTTQADLDGDDQITSNDLAISLTNLGLAGDL